MRMNACRHLQRLADMRLVDPKLPALSHRYGAAYSLCVCLCAYACMHFAYTSTYISYTHVHADVYTGYTVRSSSARGTCMQHHRRSARNMGRLCRLHARITRITRTSEMLRNEGACLSQDHHNIQYTHRGRQQKRVVQVDRGQR